ncbi:MAG: hypothetical protein OEZ22_13495 [Spirochaetia bacterium]|nr:hypothetical protein [Spirochaetia bacterium]
MSKNIFILLLILTKTNLYAADKLSESIFAKNKIKVNGFNEQQKKITIETFQKIYNINPQKLKVNNKIYNEYSNFEKLFQFKINGPNLLHWMLKRMKSLNYVNTWTVATNDGAGNISIGDEFFISTELEKMYILIHEARHSDYGGFTHVPCPDNFPFISVGQPEFVLKSAPGCDKTTTGSYAYQAAFLYEVFAYQLFENYTEAGYLYNSTVSRILPLHDYESNKVYSDENISFIFNKKNEIIKKLNNFQDIYFFKIWETENAIAYSSEKNEGARYTMIFYKNEKDAIISYKAKANRTQAVFMIAGIVVFCPYGDNKSLFKKLYSILAGMGVALK